ncbi:MAG: hypothetical protein VXU50_00055, partial [Verrucomicrobiota bacterium]|nr:hypothetical protein [Verrucomicrobiota bacterium]
MELSDAQIAAVTKWILEGRSLADVQRSLREDLGISMTYMDVRFLVDDLDIEVVKKETEVPESSEVEAAEDATAELVEAELVGEASNGAVIVDVDAIMRPGSLVSGTVVFS